MWCWGKEVRISRTDRLRSKEVLHILKEERNILHTVIRRKAKWTGNILRRNCLLKHMIERRIEVTGRRGRMRKQLLDDLKEKRGFWKLKEE
jgi:hypothetical protein